MSWTAFDDMAYHQQQPTIIPSHHHSHNNHLSSHSASPNMPAIQEDGVIALLDHPDKYFAKSTLSHPIRRESLLTTALHTDSESHDESSAPPGHRAFGRMTSRSSTCSTWSVHTDLTSDDGHISPGTQHRSPERSPSSSALHKPQLCFFRNMFSSPSRDGHDDDDKTPTQAKSEDVKSPASESSEPAVETALGRKRCISFRCGAAKDKPSDTATKVEAKSTSPAAPEPKQGPLKRLCSLRFECPTRASATALEKQAPSEPKSSRTMRRFSPPPPALAAALPQTPSPSSTRRSHRDSDSTIKNESPKIVRSKPANSRARTFSRDPYDISPSEATKFHEFASSDDDPEDWVQEQTVHRSRLTVSDTLKKENEIRNLGEQAEQEALDEDVDNEDEDEDEDEDDEDEDDFLSDDEVTDGGFQTDDEEGFADSDDESDDGSDYEWWASRRTRDKSPGVYTMLPVHAQRPDQRRRSSHDTCASDSSSLSPVELVKPSRVVKKTTSPLPIRPGTPELPDSTDFVLGTLDEDRPLEAAYASCIEQRKLAKHRAIPQDIDPTFPTSDHEPDSDNDDDGEIPQAATAVDESDSNCVQGGFEDFHGLHARSAHKITSPLRSPKRFRSPAPVKRKISPTTSTNITTTCKQRRPSPAPLNMKQRKPSPAPVSNRSPTPPRGRSRTPQLLFGHSPLRGRSPPPATRLMSPPPSRRGSTINLQEPDTALGTAFLATRPQLTHTASLPRSANAFGVHLPSSRKSSRRISEFADDKAGTDEEGELTERYEPYSRGAIDIKQGLERKRLRRRQKFHEKYLKKEERKMQRGEKSKRPQPGKGAQRMRQIGIESAIYRGKRVESL